MLYTVMHNALKVVLLMYLLSPSGAVHSWELHVYHSNSCCHVTVYLCDIFIPKIKGAHENT